MTECGGEKKGRNIFADVYLCADVKKKKRKKKMTATIKIIMIIIVYA